jgi:hypothetical protein
MALSPNETFAPPRSGITPSVSYADAVANKKKFIATTKKSMMETIVTSSISNNSNNESKEIRTRIWRHGRSPKGYLLDISKIPALTDYQHLVAINAQYGAKNFNGVKFLGKPAQRYMELYPHDSILKQFAEQEVAYQDEKIRLIPCKSLEGAGKVVQVNLSDIPLIGTAEVLKTTRETMNHFGEILDIGLNYEADMGWFMGSEYVILQQSPEKTYPTLHYTIPWGETNENCHATFPDMPTWCRYCHEEDHTKYECKKSQASVLCFACDKYSHRQADCPEPRSLRVKVKSHKKPRKTARTTNENDSMDIPANEELMKSKHAPKPTMEIQQQEEKSNHDGDIIAFGAAEVASTDDEDGEYYPDNGECIESSDEEMAEQLSIASNEVDDLQSSEMDINTTELEGYLQWSQEQPQSRIDNDNFQHLSQSPHITPSRTRSIRSFVSSGPPLTSEASTNHPNSLNY